MHVLLAARFDSSQINSSVYRQTWVKEQVSNVEASFTDGINVDLRVPFPMVSV